MSPAPQLSHRVCFVASGAGTHVQWGLHGPRVGPVWWSYKLARPLSGCRVNIGGDGAPIVPPYWILSPRDRVGHFSCVVEA